MHWFEELLSRILKAGKEEKLVSSAGLSVSGLQHVGRLRGEVILPNAVANELRDSGKDVTQYLVLYTQDSWKGKDEQLDRFREARKQGKGDAQGKDHVNRRLIDVPDPYGCCENWVEHYWRDFGDFLEGFANDVKAVTTTQLYERRDMQDIVLDIVKRKDEVREVVNKYRGENKYDEGWIPFEPYCSGCGKIGTADTLEIKNGSVLYKCSCGDQGSSPIEKGKLNWRLEWPALWKLL
ncbi:MAG: lysine--tRNA ligase, partial [Thermoplasmata archaeon]|nr:lysine--tRNA ligase [Thermoplasmata archaeon]